LRSRTGTRRARLQGRAGRGEQVGWGASGRSGGQAIFGFGTDIGTIAAQVGPETARRLWDVSIDALDWVRDRVARHGIDCDLHWGHMHVATKPRQRDELLELQHELAETYGYRSPRFLERDGAEALLATRRYCAGLFDPRSGHLHPLNYTLGSHALRSRPACRSSNARRSSGSNAATRCGW